VSAHYIHYRRVMEPFALCGYDYMTMTTSTSWKMVTCPYCHAEKAQPAPNALKVRNSKARKRAEQPEGGA